MPAPKRKTRRRHSPIRTLFPPRPSNFPRTAYGERGLIRQRLGLTQEEFARRFGLRLEMVLGWEDRTLVPDTAAVTLLRVIWAEPETVRRVVAAE